MQKQRAFICGKETRDTKSTSLHQLTEAEEENLIAHLL